MKTGVCYYPEHWPEEQRPQDPARMRELGLRIVRIGEFAWSRLKGLRDFGSHRHYCFSHEPYLDECRRIVTVLAEKFGDHPGVIAWQTDNEYGCHSTSISDSSHALAAFRRWCAEHYADIDALNLA